MFYQKKSNEELMKYHYPNFIAELIESGYSICTLGDHMGLGRHRQEDDPEVWDKLKGHKDILESEMIQLSRLFSVKVEYLFSHNLVVLGGKPLAYWRWYDDNQRKEQEHQERIEIDEIVRELKEKPYLLEFMKAASSWDKEQINKAIAVLKMGDLHDKD